MEKRGKSYFAELSSLFEKGGTVAREGDRDGSRKTTKASAYNCDMKLLGHFRGR
jgi:hypothetical protein